MTTKIYRVVVGVGVESHVSKLGTFFLMSLTLRMPILGKKSHWTWAGECRKVFIAIFTSIESHFLLKCKCSGNKRWVLRFLKSILRKIISKSRIQIVFMKFYNKIFHICSLLRFNPQSSPCKKRHNCIIIQWFKISGYTTLLFMG